MTPQSISDPLSFTLKRGRSEKWQKLLTYRDSAPCECPHILVIDISYGKMRRILCKGKVCVIRKVGTSCSNALIGIEYAADVNHAD